MKNEENKNIIKYHDFWYWQEKKQMDTYEYIAIKMEIAESDLEKLINLNIN